MLRRAGAVEVRVDAPSGDGELGGKLELSTWKMVTLTAGLAGAQLTWTVEMAFGTPYLLAMGLSKEATSLVWLAGPLSGLLVQPVIGALSDAHSPRYRRRFFIVLSTILVIASTLLVAFAKELAAVLAGLSGLGDWDPEAGEKVKTVQKTLAVIGFWVLDFGLNGVQASLRALILDTVPSAQQPLSNAYHSRMTALGNIVGGVREGIQMLPKEVKRVCFVQFFAWTAYFPFLFYSTTYISQTHLLLNPHPTQSQLDAATRLGSLALLYYAILSLVTSTFLPVLTSMSPEKMPRWTRKCLAKCTLRNYWTFGLLQFGLCMALTFGVGAGDTGKAMAIVAASGVSWGIATWVPFALIMEAIRDAEDFTPLDAPSRSSSPSPSPPSTPVRHSPPFRASLPPLRTTSTTQHASERSPLLPATSTDVNDSAIVRREVSQTMAREKRRGKTGGGTILGIHNLAIVAPQFLVSVIAAGIFRILDGSGKESAGGGGGGEEVGVGSNDVVWVLRFGGLAALGGAIASRWASRP
ncbi:hypothetical protein MNV49_003772 [Pseudohyphozyma bogoriensis]|nr:hypothetical protein MNV49_003772 [Pseudohyphozyma bogoriensis]